MKLLICDEGSLQAAQAVKVGAQLATAMQAEVTLLGILEKTADSKPLFEALHRAQSTLTDKKIPTELVTQSGDAIEEIVRRTETTAYDLVIIGAARKTSVGAFWISSKSYKLIKQIQAPVLTVMGAAPSLDRILVCSGGKRHIESAIEFTGGIAAALRAQVTIVHVMADPPAIFARLPLIEEDAEWLLHSRSELGVNLRRARDTLAGQGVDVRIRLRHGDVLDGLLREIHEGDYGMVVAGSVVSRGLRTYVLGDITRELLNRANRPVLVVRSQVKPMGLPSRLRELWGRR